MVLTFSNAMKHFSSLSFLRTPFFQSRPCQMSFKLDLEHMNGRAQDEVLHYRSKGGGGMGVESWGELE